MLHKEAMFIDSYTKPSPRVPSPKKTIAMAFFSSNFMARPAPVAAAAIPPWMPLVKKFR
jgi:hypothetical protein